MILSLSACSQTESQPTEALPTEKVSPQPEILVTEAPDTTKPEVTTAPNDVDSSGSSSEPISDWFGIPIMEGANQLQYTDAQLAFYSTAAMDEISSYYINALIQLGYQQGVVEDNQTGGVMLEFSNDTQYLVITILDMIEQRMVFMILN
jgi:hypothetical protein